MTKSNQASMAKLAGDLLTELGRENGRSIEQRTYNRKTSSELHVMIGGIRFNTIDWSLGGMLLKGLGNRLKVGDRLQVLLWDGVDELRHHAVTAMVLRLDENKGGIAFHFVQMSPATMPWLSDLQRSF